MIYTVTLNPALDKSYVIRDFGAGKLNRVLESRSDPGGKGINVSKTICALGGQSVAMGIVGGETGKYIVNSLAQMGIACDFVQGSRETRTNIKISDPVSNTTTDINESGFMDAEACEAVFERLLGRVKAGDIAVIAGKIDLTKCDLARQIQALVARGARVLLDTEGEALKQGVQAGPYLIKPNEEEFRALAEKDCGDIPSLAAQAARLGRRYDIARVVVSLGQRGALFVSDGEAYYAPALPVTSVSTVGAGDAMCAALSYGLDKGLDEMEINRLSMAASAAAVCTPGSQSPEKTTIEALLPLTEIRRIL